MLVLPALILLVLEGYHRNTIVPEIARSQSTADRTFAVITTARKLNLAAEDAERAQRNFLITANATYHKAYEAAAAQVRQRLAQLKALTAAEPDQQRRIALLDTQLRAQLTALDTLTETLGGKGFDAAKRTVDKNASFDTMRIIAGVIDNLIQAERHPFDERQAHALAAARTSAGVTFLAALIAAGVTFLGGSLLVFLVWYNRRLRKRLADSEARFRLMVDEVSDYAIFMLDTMGRVASWNNGAERINGYRAEEILGRHFSCFYPEEEARPKIPDRQLGRAAADGRVAAEGWRVRQDGSRYRADMVITALHDERGRLRGFATITRDITERFQQQQVYEQTR